MILFRQVETEWLGLGRFTNDKSSEIMIVVIVGLMSHDPISSCISIEDHLGLFHIGGLYTEKYPPTSSCFVVHKVSQFLGGFHTKSNKDPSINPDTLQP